MTLRVLIVDDERLARAKLQRYLAREPDVDSTRECANGADALAEIGRDQPDVLFLDVQMPAIGGFELLRRIGSSPVPGLVFVTAYDQYAVQAFDVEAADYLLKPFDRQRFETAFDRARRRVAAASAGRATESPAGATARSDPARIVIHTGRRLVPVNVEEIEWIASADNYACLRTTHDNHLVREPLGRLAARLDARSFVRIHRGAIVSISAIAGIQRRKNGGHEVALRSGQTLPVGRSYRRRLLRLLSR